VFSPRKGTHGDRQGRRGDGDLRPGATNLVTGIADAYLDSVPLVAITGQVPQHMIGKGAFQETDVFGVTAQIVKHNYLVMDVNDIPRIVKEAFYIAQTGRPGPVLIDIPKNIQQAKTQPIFPRNQVARLQSGETCR
jgi:acetolactate synthase-1/2/3 large subunit